MKKEDAYILGGKNSEQARRIGIKLVKCHDKPYCKSDEEITDYYKGSQLIMLNNQIRFDENFYGADSIIQESILTAIPFSV